MHFTLRPQQIDCFSPRRDSALHPGKWGSMKSIVFGLTAILFAASASAQTAPAQSAGTDATQTAKTEQATAPVPTVPVQREKPKNTATIVLGAVGVAALLGAASSGGGGSKSKPPVSQPSSP